MILGAVACGGGGGGGDGHDGGGGGSATDAAVADAAANGPDAAEMPDGAPLDAAPPERLWVAYLADAVTDGQVELYLVDVASGVPGEALRVNRDLVSGSVTAEPQWSPDGGSILYHAAEDVMFTHELFAAAVDWQGPHAGVKIHQPLTATGAIEQNGGLWNGYDWSPDGSRMRFHGRLADEPIGLYVVDAAAPGTAHRVNPLPEHEDMNLREMADWSPDSRTLLYQALDPGENLYAVDVASTSPGEPARINPDPEVPGGRVVPSYRGLAFWSPDGSKILYRGDLEVDEQYELYVTSFAGGVAGATYKVNGELAAGGDVTEGVSAPFWSPDGTKVLYRADQEVNDRFDLYVVDMTAEIPGPAQRVNHTLALAGGVEDNSFTGQSHFGWSPDSTRVIYHEPRPELPTFPAGDLWIVDVAGAAPGTPQRIRVNGGIASSFAWSPDSAHLAFSRGRTLAVYMIDTSGPLPWTPVLVGGDLGLRLASYLWSPDGARLAVRAALVNGGPDAIWLTTPADPETAVLVSAEPVEDGDVTGGPMRWSADSRRMIYAMRQPPHIEVHLVDLTSGAPAPAVRINGPLVDGGNVTEYWIQPAAAP